MSVVAKQAAAVQQSLEVERIRQHPGQQQVSRAVKVSVPGKHFTVVCGGMAVESPLKSR